VFDDDGLQRLATTIIMAHPITHIRWLIRRMTNGTVPIFNGTGRGVTTLVSRARLHVSVADALNSLGLLSHYRQNDVHSVTSVTLLALKSLHIIAVKEGIGFVHPVTEQAVRRRADIRRHMSSHDGRGRCALVSRIAPRQVSGPRYCCKSESCCCKIMFRREMQRGVICLLRSVIIGACSSRTQFVEMTREQVLADARRMLSLRCTQPHIGSGPWCFRSTPRCLASIAH